MLNGDRKEGKIRANEAIQKWLDNWRISQSPAGHAYLAALGMAGSMRQLERFHKALPDNLRLLRKDFDFIKELWKKCFPFEAGMVWREEFQMKAVQMIGRKNPGMEQMDSCWYYIHEIFYASCKKEHKYFSDYNRSSERYSICVSESSSEFFIEIFGKIVSIDFYLSMYGGYLLAVLIFKRAELTGLTADSIINNLPEYHLMEFGSVGETAQSPSGPLINVSFQLKLNDELQCCIVKDPERSLYRVAPEFLTKAADFLRVSAIPVEGFLTQKRRAE